MHAACTYVAMSEEMHNFYDKEDLYTYMEGSTPSLDQVSSGEDDDVVFVTKDEVERKVANIKTNEVRLLSRDSLSIPETLGSTCNRPHL